MHRSAALPSLAVLLIAASLAAGSPQQQPQQTVSRISGPNDRNPVEVSVAINPARPDNVIAVSYQQGVQPPPPVTDFIYVSNDGGRTWASQRAANPDNRTQGDDSVTFDEAGTAYHAYISYLGIRQQHPRRAVTGIFVTRVDDGGSTWSAPVAAVDHLNTVLPFEDKPWIAATRSSTGEQRVYLAWTRFDEYGSKAPDCRSHIVFTRSTDGGKTFAMPFRISDVPGDCQDSDNTAEGAVPAVGPDGEVYVAWAGPAGLVIDKSADGVTFGNDVKIADLPGGWDIEIPGAPRSNGMPVTSVDRSSGPNRGAVYVNWIDQRNGDSDVFAASSRDGGRTWTPPVRVNDDPIRNGKAQFFTWMAVDPVDGSVNVLFYDRRGLDGTKTALTFARSTDGARTFTNYAVKLPPFEMSRSPAFGDYLGVAAFGGRVVGAFPYFVDSRTIALGAVRFDFAK